MNKYLYILASLVISFFLMYVGIYFVGKYILPDVFESGPVEEGVKTDGSTEDILHKRAPVFNLPSVTGNRESLVEYFGTPTVIIFWASWNKTSADQIGIIDTYLKKESTQASLIKVLAISSQEDSSIVSSFMRRGEYDVSVLLDTNGDISHEYSIKDFPTIFFVGRDGRVNEVYRGILSAPQFVEKVDSLLKQKGVE